MGWAKCKKPILSALFILIGIFLLLGIQQVLTPKWRYPRYWESSDDILGEFSTLKENEDIQALFLGTSHVEFSVSPMQIYQQSGIVSYNLATNLQPLNVSEYLLNAALKTCTPKVVFLDASSLFTVAFNNAANRYILDNHSLKNTKIIFARDYASNFSVEKRCGAFLSSILPIWQYHDRWTELNEFDFHNHTFWNYYRKGYFLKSVISPSGITVDTMNFNSEYILNSAGWTWNRIDGVVVNESDITSLSSIEIRDTCRDTLLRIKKHCEEYGVEFRLIKIPDIGLPQSIRSSWTKDKSLLVKNLCGEYGIVFLDLLYDVDLGIDWATDTIDGGMHLN